MTSSISSLLLTALLCVPNLYLLNFKAFLLSLAEPVLINSMTFIKYCNPLFIGSEAHRLPYDLPYKGNPFAESPLPKARSLSDLRYPCGNEALFKPTANPFIV